MLLGEAPFGQDTAFIFARACTITNR